MELLRIHKNRSLDNRKCQQFNAPWQTNNFSKNTPNPTTADWMAGVKTTVETAPVEGNSVGASTTDSNSGATQSSVLEDLSNYNQTREKEQTDRNNISDKDYFGQAITTRSFDTNGNGHIGKHEFRNWLNNNGFGNMSKSVQKMFRGYMNGKNSITPEMAAYMNNSQNLNPVSKATQQKLAKQEADEAKLNDSDFQTYARQQFVNDQKNTASKKFKDMNYNDLLAYAQEMYKAGDGNKWDTSFGDFTQFGGARGKVTNTGMDNLINNGMWENPYEREAFKDAWVRLRDSDAAHTVKGTENTNYTALDNDAYTKYDQGQWDANKNSYVNMDRYNTMLQSQEDTAQAEANKKAWSTVRHKQGGSLKMKVNYFQTGGAVTTQTANSQQAQDIQTQVVQLVQAAMQGDQKATQAVQQIMDAAKKGDQQAVQIAQLIQKVVKQMQGQTKAAKRGAKLSYLHSLKTGCPDGYEVSYNKKGGHLCKECLKKHADGGEVSVEDKPIESSKITPKSAFSSKLKKKLISGKKLAEGAKVTTPAKEATKNFFGGNFI